MKRIAIACTLIFSLGTTLAFAAEALNDHWSKELKSLSPSVAKKVEVLIRCASFGGDQLSPEQQENWNALKCRQREKIFSELRSKNKNNPKVLRILNCVEVNASAEASCPDPLDPFK